jgi:uncharacterized protein
MAEDDVVARVLINSDLWFVVGLRENPARAAYGVARMLQRVGKRIVPIHPKFEQVHGARGYATIAEAAAVEGRPDVVDVFVRSQLAGGIVQEAIEVGAGAVWLQLGVIDHAAAEEAAAAGLDVVMDRCPAIEWPRVVDGR